jgi:hypothetical protein
VAGNTTTSTAGLAITTSLTELTPLVARFDVPFVKRLVLLLQLAAAEHAHERGDVDQAVAWVRHFRHSASHLRDHQARTTLTADADLVIARLRR